MRNSEINEMLEDNEQRFNKINKNLRYKWIGIILLAIIVIGVFALYKFSSISKHTIVMEESPIPEEPKPDPEPVVEEPTEEVVEEPIAPEGSIKVVAVGLSANTMKNLEELCTEAVLYGKPGDVYGSDVRYVVGSIENKYYEESEKAGDQIVTIDSSFGPKVRIK